VARPVPVTGDQDVEVALHYLTDPVRKVSTDPMCKILAPVPHGSGL